MGAIPLTALVIFALTTYIGGINGFSTGIPKKIFASTSQPIKSGQGNTSGDLSVPSLLQIFSSFKHQDPVIAVPLKGKNDDVLESRKNEEFKTNITLQNKTDEVAGIVENGETKGLGIGVPIGLPASASQNLSYEQENKIGDFHIPFLRIFTGIERLNPFADINSDEKTDDALLSGKNEESKVNRTQRSKTDEDIVENGEIKGLGISVPIRSPASAPQNFSLGQENKSGDYIVSRFVHVFTIFQRLNPIVDGNSEEKDDDALLSKKNEESKVNRTQRNKTDEDVVENGGTHVLNIDVPITLPASASQNFSLEQENKSGDFHMLPNPFFHLNLLELFDSKEKTDDQEKNEESKINGMPQNKTVEVAVIAEKDANSKQNKTSNVTDQMSLLEVFSTRHFRSWGTGGTEATELEKKDVKPSAATTFNNATGISKRHSD